MVIQFLTNTNGFCKPTNLIFTMIWFTVIKVKKALCGTIFFSLKCLHQGLQIVFQWISTTSYCFLSKIWLQWNGCIRKPLSTAAVVSGCTYHSPLFINVFNVYVFILFNWVFVKLKFIEVNSGKELKKFWTINHCFYTCLKYTSLYSRVCL